MAAVTLGRGGAGPGHAQPGQGHAAADRAARLGASFEQARAGDQAAMREVVAQLNPLLWRVARAQGLAAEEAADVVQTSWLELVRRLNDIRSPQALTAWLITATRREAWRVREQARRHVSGPGSADSLDAVPDPVCCPTAARSCCASSRRSAGPTTPRSPRRSACRSAALAPPAAAAWPSSGPCWPRTLAGADHDHPGGRPARR